MKFEDKICLKVYVMYTDYDTVKIPGQIYSAIAMEQDLATK